MDATLVSQYESKLTLLLDSFLAPHYKIKNECYLSSLLTHLSGNVDDVDDHSDLANRLLQLPAVIRWVPKSIIHWENHNVPPPSLSISTFTLNLIALLSKDEGIFLQYHSSSVYPKLFEIFKICSPNVTPTIKLAYVRIMASFLRHQSGTDWLMTNGDVWKGCLKFCLANQTIYIIREGHNFIYNLLIGTLDSSPAFVESVVAEILGKFKEDGFYTTEDSLFPEIQDEILQKDFCPTVKLLLNIFEFLHEGDLYEKRDYRLADLFINRHNLIKSIEQMLLLVRSVDFSYDLYNLLYRLYFFELLVNTKTNLFAQADLYATGKKIFDIFNRLINTSQIANVVKLAHLADSLWSKLGDRLPQLEQRAGKAPFLFRNQLIILQVMPLFGVSLIHFNIKYNAVDEDDMRSAFVDDILKMMCEETIRMGYTWRTMVIAQPDAFGNGKLALMYVMKYIKNYDKQRAIWIFQSLVYTLKDVNDAIMNVPTINEVMQPNINFLVTMFEAIALYIVKFDFTWRESVETICVLACALEFLNHSLWPPRVVVQALKLVNLSIEKFLSPHLALLVEDEDEATMNTLGTMLCGKLLDTSWEVRDSALEIVHTVANISNSKYPSYQKMLIDLDIITLVVTMCVSDSEGFVRASAIKCLQEMIQVQTLWVVVLIKQELPKKMMHILRHETEAIVRTEAASLMRYIHEHQSFPNDQMDEIYESMAYAATSDLHWEVKSNALDFWGKVILNHLHDQGFIDGKFPNVTFSKENRKIVTLTDNEIKIRLNKILGQLSKNGCLGVFVNAIQDECDLEVAKKALIKTKKVASILNSYNIRASSYQEGGSVPKSPVIDFNPPLPPTAQKIDMSDDVIDQIINSDDMSLLANCYSPDYETVSNGIHNNLKLVTPDMFVNFIQKDLDSMILNKTKWLNKMDNLDSLLNDMLQNCGNDDQCMNSMDCY